MEAIANREEFADRPDFYEHLGDVYLLAKQPDKARAAWQKALTLFPKTTESGDRRKAAIEKKLKELKK
jgi:hypothetical protein